MKQPNISRSSCRHHRAAIGAGEAWGIERDAVPFFKFTEDDGSKVWGTIRKSKHVPFGPYEQGPADVSSAIAIHVL